MNSGCFTFPYFSIIFRKRLLVWVRRGGVLNVTILVIVVLINLILFFVRTNLGNVLLLFFHAAKFIPLLTPPLSRNINKGTPRPIFVEKKRGVPFKDIFWCLISFEYYNPLTDERVFDRPEDMLDNLEDV